MSKQQKEQLTAGERDQRGFSMIETLISVVVLSFAMGGLYSLLIHNSQINKSEQMRAEAQSNARSVLAVVVQKVRSAGWDPLGGGAFAGITVDSDFSDAVSELTVRSDFDSILNPGDPDGLATQLDEEIEFRHSGNTLMWRRQPGGRFEVLAMNISNDADGDGTIENMFIPDSNVNPTRITIQVTATSPVVDPISKDFTRYTVSADVVLRKEI